MGVSNSLSGGGGGGPINAGPGSSTDNAIVRWDGTGGNDLQNSVVTIDDVGVVAGVTQLNVDNLRLDSNTLSSTDANGNITLAPNGTGQVAIPAATSLSFGSDVYLSRNSANVLQIGTTPGTKGAGIYLSQIQVFDGNNSVQLLAPNIGAVALASGQTVTWSSSATAAYPAQDTSISRIAAGVVGVGTGAAGSFAGTTKETDHIYESANGATWTQGQSSELLTLSTSGTTTDTTANLLPANSIIEAVVARVTTTITTATDWELGDSLAPARFAPPNATMTAGATSVGLTHQADTTHVQTTAAKVRVTTTGTPGAGAIRITVFYRQFVAPTS